MIHPPQSIGSPPAVSVIIAAPTQGQALGACLAALARQTYPATGYEVVVVLGSRSVAALVPTGTISYRLRVVQARGRSHGAALNQGAAVATGRLYLFLGADCVADPALIAEHVAGHRDQSAHIGVGTIRRDTPPGRVSGSGGAYDSRNMSVPCELFRAVGGFATDLPGGLGLDLAYRLHQQGYGGVRLPAASVTLTGAQRGPTGGASERAGRAAWALYARHPALLAELKLGAFNDTSVRALLLRRLLLAARVPPRLLHSLGRLLGWSAGAAKWQHFASTYAYWTGVRRAVPNRDVWERLLRPPVILMYHAVGGRGEQPSRYVIPAARLARQLAWLHRRRYPVLPLEELVRCRLAHRLPPARAVALTFDDGYADNGTLAGPLLRRYGFPATIFLVSQAVGGVNGWDGDGELAWRPLLSWRDINALRAEGVSFGAHTRNHVPLTDVPPAQARIEIAGARCDLEVRLKADITLFAYPHGKHDARTQAAVADAGYLGACCSVAGLNDPAVPPFALRRSEVRGTDSLLGFMLLPLFGRARLQPRRAAGRAECHE